MYSNGISNQIIKFKNWYIGNFMYMSCQFTEYRAQKCMDFPSGNTAQLAELELRLSRGSVHGSHFSNTDQVGLNHRLNMGLDLQSLVKLVAHWPAVRQARVQIPAGHPREVFPAERKQ
jgi:hypothetical protein